MQNTTVVFFVFVHVTICINSTLKICSKCNNKKTTKKDKGCEEVDTIIVSNAQKTQQKFFEKFSNLSVQIL